MSTTRVLPSETPRNQACGDTVFLFCGAVDDAARKRAKPKITKAQASAALERITNRFCMENSSVGTSRVDKFYFSSFFTLRFLRLVHHPRWQTQGNGMPGEATMPAMRKISEYSSSVNGHTVSRVFLRNLILRSNLFSRNSARVTWRGKRSIARRSITIFFGSFSCGSGYGSRLTSAKA